MSTTPIDSISLKKHKKELRFITDLFARAKNRFSFKKLLTFKDALLAVGYSEGEVAYIYSEEQLARAIIFSELKAMEANALLRKEMEYRVLLYQDQSVQTHEYEGAKYPDTSNLSYNNVRVDSEESFKQTKEEKDKDEDKQEIPILHSPHQKAKLFKFQNKAAWQILQKIIDKKTLDIVLRAVLLRAGVGVGKTFILAAVIRQLLDMGLLEKHQCVSPWPILWITRASIVEQTKRVCKDLFGIDTYTTCQVVNIEQLRAKLGDLMIEWSTIVSGGEEHIVCKWKPRIHPLVFIIDECQLAKNEDSTQSKIIQAIAEIPATEPIIVICSSATPFTRVSESRYFVVNTWKTICEQK